MKKWAGYCAGLVMASAALIPPVRFDLTAPVSLWPWMVLISGFLGFFLWFLPASLFVKGLSTWAWFSCFFAASPFISFTAYSCLIVACYFHTVCLNWIDFRPVFRLMGCLGIFFASMLIMQVIGRDTLLNFGVSLNCFGTVGQHMQAASFGTILSAVFSLLNPYLLILAVPVSLVCNSAGAFLSAGAGILFYIWMDWHKRMAIGVTLVLVAVFAFWIVVTGKFNENVFNEISRVKVWTRTVQMSAQRPGFGWGVGSYRYIFPAIGQVGATGEFGEPDTFKSIPWKTAHNCWLQFFFELGVVGGAIVIGYFCFLLLGLRRMLCRAAVRWKAVCGLSSLAAVGVNMAIHFPTRQISTIPLILFILAYLERLVRDGGE